MMIVVLRRPATMPLRVRTTVAMMTPTVAATPRAIVLVAIDRTAMSVDLLRMVTTCTEAPTRNAALGLMDPNEVVVDLTKAP